MEIDFPLREDMLSWAKGDRGATAGVQLLIDHRWMPERLLEAGYVMRGDGWAAPLFAEAVADDADKLGELSHSEDAILRIAGSLAGKVEVNLSRALATLDGRNHSLVVNAVRLYAEL